MKETLGIYIHIPFCLRKCLYCDFCSFPQRTDIYEAYTDALTANIKQFAPLCVDRRVSTLYFGGGTPTLLPIGCFERLMSELFSCFDIDEGAEITAECNPATASAEYLKRLRRSGVNRLSLGLQSIHEKELSALGRAHSCSELIDTYHLAREAGFGNISIDLMYGIPEQTPESFRQSLMAVCRLSPEHISAYGLKIEEGTPFYKMKDSLSLPDEDGELEMYLLMSEMLEGYGYRKYEISNFAKVGFESRHNLRYWEGKEYLGLGVAAHSYFLGERFGNSRDIDAFLRGECIECERSTIGEDEGLCEYIMLSLRLSRGIELSEFEKKTKKSFFEFYGRAQEMIAMGYMRVEDGRIAFTDKGFFVSNAILADMLDF